MTRQHARTCTPEQPTIGRSPRSDGYEVPPDWMQVGRVVTCHYPEYTHEAGCAQASCDSKDQMCSCQWWDVQVVAHLGAAGVDVVGWDATNGRQAPWENLGVNRCRLRNPAEAMHALAPSKNLAADLNALVRIDASSSGEVVQVTVDAVADNAPGGEAVAGDEAVAADAVAEGAAAEAVVVVPGEEQMVWALLGGDRGPIVDGVLAQGLEDMARQVEVGDAVGDGHLGTELRRLRSDQGVWGVVKHGISTSQGSGSVCCGCVQEGEVWGAGVPNQGDGGEAGVEADGAGEAGDPDGPDEHS